MIHGHVHIIISCDRPQDSWRGSTDRECHFKPRLALSLFLSLSLSLDALFRFVFRGDDGLLRLFFFTRWLIIIG